MSAKQKKILLHLLACVVFMALPVLLSHEESLRDILGDGRTKKDFITYILMIGIFYLNFFVLIPRLYFHKKTFVYFILLQVACFVFIAFLLSFIHFIPHEGVQHHQWPHFRAPQFPVFAELKRHLFLYLMVVFVALTLSISHRWEITEKEKVNAELSYLKAQINPHFLFNTLNSIYSLAIQKSDNAPDAIVKLSEMMRYILTEAAQPFVSLKKELSQVDNYIELQKIRLGNTVAIHYSFSGASDKQLIAPLILIHFIENAFKHGVNPDEKSGIDISVRVDNNQLFFKVSNNKVNSENKAELNSGTGIENARTRLQILYSGKHKLLIVDTAEKFAVELELTLS